MFHDAHQQLELYSIPIFRLSNALELGSETIAITGLSTGELFTILEFKLSEAGRKIGDPAAAWSQWRGIDLLQTLPDIMQLYTELLIRHSPYYLRKRLYWQNRANKAKIEGTMETAGPSYGKISVSWFIDIVFYKVITALSH